MISYNQLKRNANTRLKDASILYKEKRYDSANYLCGYAIEIGLKAVICKNLRLEGMPSTSQEFTIIQQLKTHDLENLLGLTSQKIKEKIKSQYLAEWGIIQDWDPERRYKPIAGKRIEKNTKELLEATVKVLKYLCKKL